MTHAIEVRVKVEGIEEAIVFYVSDMPPIEASVKKNLNNFNAPYPAWQWAKWQESGKLHCICRGNDKMKVLTRDIVEAGTCRVLAEAGDVFETFDKDGIEKWQKRLAFEHEQRNKGQLALDTIDCALNMAGYDIGAMNQFEKAHALMDMAQELKALASVRQCDAVCTACTDTLCANYKGGNDYHPGPSQAIVSE